MEIAEFRIDKGINVSVVDWGGETALHMVVAGKQPKEEMMTLLVEAGADVEPTSGRFTPLHEAARYMNVRMVQCLLDLGTDPKAAEGMHGLTPVDIVHLYSNRATVQCLLEAR